MARKRIIAGNWKMNMPPSEAVKLVEELKPLVVNDDVDVVYCVLFCGTGIGISVAAYQVPGVIAAVCSEPYSAKLTKQHNNANVIAFGARVVGVELAKMILDEFFGAEFEGGRHQARVDMIHGIEADYSK